MNPTLQDAFQNVENYYEERGIFRNAPEFGKRPALVVVDMAYGWTDPAYPCGSERLDEAVEHIQTLLHISRAKSVPIVYTTAFFRQGQQDPAVTRETLNTKFRIWDARAVEIDVRLKPQPGELVIQKESASAFFGTPLVSFLVEHAVDTVIVTGCSTSTCIRATVTDAQSFRFKTIVPRECVQDRAEPAHLWNLFDLESKNGVVVSTAQVLDYLQTLEPRTE